MKSIREIKRAAWKIVCGPWFWRLLVAGAVLNAISQTVLHCLDVLYKHLEIKTYTNFLLAKTQALQGGLDFTLPSSAVGWQMLQATAFEMFVTYLFAAILAFGFSAATLKATANDETKWFSCAFGGYRRPFELFCLVFVMNLIVFFATLLFVIPGLIAVYRYRSAWYLKVEHPDYGVRKCLSESARMMHGHKAEAFFLDLSYLGWLAGGIVLIVVAFVLNTAFPALSALSAFGFMIYIAFALCYYFVGRTVFYREVKAVFAQPADSETKAPATDGAE